MDSKTTAAASSAAAAADCKTVDYESDRLKILRAMSEPLKKQLLLEVLASAISELTNLRNKILNNPRYLLTDEESVNVSDMMSSLDDIFRYLSE